MARNDVRRLLSPEELADYEELMYQATHLEGGARRPSAEIGPEMLRLLDDAIQAQRPWATWVKEGATLSGLRSHGVKWVNARERLTTALNGVREISKAAARGVRRKDAQGRAVHQQTLWEDMFEDDLAQIARRAGGQILAERENIAIARRLSDLIARTGRMPVSEALASIGMSLEEFLGQEDAA